MGKKQTHAEELISKPVIKLETPEAIENFCKVLAEPDSTYDLGKIEGKFDKIYVPSPSALEAVEKIKTSNCIIEDEYYHQKVGECFDEELGVIEATLKAFENIKELFDFDFAIRFGNNQPMLRITNKRTNEYWEIPIKTEMWNLLKEVLL